MKPLSAFITIFALLPLITPSAALPPPSVNIVKRYSGVKIVSARRLDKCLGTTFIRGALVTPGVLVDLVDCSSALVLDWDIERGAGYVKVSSADLVLDAGNNAGNFGVLRFETPVQGRGSQNWYYTDDDRIAITGGNQCLDDDGARLQTYQCTTGNTNQIYTNDPPATINPYPDIPTRTEFYPDASGERRRLHPFNRGDLCATILGGFTAGNAVAIAYCLADTDPLSKYQIFNPQGSFSRIAVPIYVADSPNLCLSSTGQNGVGITLQICDSAKAAWQWSQSEQYFFYKGQRICMDVQRESQAGNESPISSLRKLQTWECGDGNVQQKWTFFW